VSALLDGAYTILEDTPRAADGILVAFSGGLDSRVALDLAIAYGAEHDVPVHSVHVDHDLRDDSAEDASFCEDTCAMLGIAHTTTRVSIPPGESTQAAARAQRWAAIALEAARLGVRCVVTGHHAQDAIEGALIQMMRGSSSQGMSSLARTRAPIPVPGLGELITVARPLARWWPDEIRARAEDRGLAWHEDPTNATSAYTRNHLRHEFVGELLALQGSRSSALRTLTHLARDADAIAQAADAFTRQHVRVDGDTEVIVSRAEAAALPEAVLARALIMTLGVARDAREVRALAHVARAGTPRTITSRVRARARGDTLVLERARKRGARDLGARQALRVELGTEALPEGCAPWFGGVLSWTTESTPSSSAAHELLARFSRARPPVALRGPRPGERVAMASGREERVVEVLRRAGFDPMDKWRAPCVVDADDAIVWIPGCMLAPSSSGDVTMTWTPRSESLAKGNV